MIKLRKIITQLDEAAYQKMENNLQASKGDNFLFLLRAYRSSSKKDPEIASILGISTNSLYVLKSRLNDKIQENLSGDLFANREDVIKQLHRVPDMMYSSSPEITEAF